MKKISMLFAVAASLALACTPQKDTSAPAQQDQPAAAQPAAAVGSLTGAGATFPYPIYAKWAEAYRKDSGVGMNYQSIGSGGGIKQIKAGTVDFGASDRPLAPEDLKASGLVQFPAIMGGVIPVVNLAGVAPGTLKLTGANLADIYLGKIKTWDDPALKATNPDLELPSARITTVQRSDGSGTTFLFTDYLSKVSPEWKEKVGAETAVSWPGGGVGGKGNEGVASYVKQFPNSIGYVEYAYALQNDMNYAQLQNADGQFVKPELESFQAAAANADWAAAENFYLVLTQQPGVQSWPITGASFILMHQKPKKPEQAAAALRFFDWAFRNGDQMAKDLHYIPMPAPVVTLIEESWKQIQGPDGKPVWTPPAR